MEKLIVKQITTATASDVKKITSWMYNWWGKRDGRSFKEVECYVKHSFNKDRLPQTYGLFLNNNLIGIYHFTYSDFEIRPDLYPWLANVFIDPIYRHQGYSRFLLASVEDNAKKNGFKELFLYTKEENLYEQYEFQYLGPFNTFKEKPKIQRLYCLRLKNDNKNKKRIDA